MKIIYFIIALIFILSLIWFLVSPKGERSAIKRFEEIKAKEQEELNYRRAIKEPSVAIKSQIFAQSKKNDLAGNLLPRETHEVDNTFKKIDFQKGPLIQVSQLKDKEGKLLLMNQSSAIKACADRGMHLPTARELAKIIQSRGGKGILVEGGESYERVVAIDSDGKRDEFYYSSKGYIAPASEDKYEFLSASVDADPERPSNPPCILSLRFFDSGDYFIGCSGHYDLTRSKAVPDVNRDSHSAVLCVEDKK